MDYYVDPNVSYASILKKTHAEGQSDKSDISELKFMMKDLMTQISTMLNLLTAVVVKLN